MHVMTEISEVSGEHLFHCYEPGCGRQVAFRPDDLSWTVLSPGDVFARHAATTAPDVLSMRLGE